MPSDSRLKDVEARLKAARWKKVSTFFYVDLDDTTMAHVQVFYNGPVLRVQAGVTNRVLNRIVWDIAGLPKDFGTPKEQLNTARRCSLAVAHAALEIEATSLDAGVAQRIVEFTLTNAHRFNSITKIRQEIMLAQDAVRSHVVGDLACVELARGDRRAALAIVERAKADDPLFETTFLGMMERFLARHVAYGARHEIR